VSGRPRGRPRSDQAHRAILEATRDLLIADGYDQLSIEAIAARAGVGKQTVYRWWPSKAAVVAEAVVEGYVATGARVRQETGDVLADLRAWFHEQVTRLTDGHLSTLVRALAAAAADSDVDAARLYDHLTGPAREDLVQRLRGGVENGQLRPDADLEAAADALIGTLLYHVLARRGAVTHQRADGLLEILITGMANRHQPGNDPIS
jgi:AcrR family transcriptional regulator